MKDAKETIEAEIVSVVQNLPKSVNTSPKQLRQQMQRDQDLRAVITEYIKNNMVEGKDYGSITIKGKKSKPSLLKPGAEKFCGLFKIRPTFQKDTETIEMLGNKPGIIAYVCNLVDSRGQIVGEGRGSVSVDPSGQDFDINKAIKIAEKRSQIDAVLRAGGLSDFFTQDIEDMPRGELGNGEAEPLATAKQKNLISKLFMEQGATTTNLLLASIKANGVKDAKTMTMFEASELIKKLFSNTAAVARERKVYKAIGPDEVKNFRHSDAQGDDSSMYAEDEDLGRGAGDPDMYGYPSEEEVTDEAIEESLTEAVSKILGEEN